MQRKGNRKRRFPCCVRVTCSRETCRPDASCMHPAMKLLWQSLMQKVLLEAIPILQDATRTEILRISPATVYNNKPGSHPAIWSSQPLTCHNLRPVIEVLVIATWCVHHSYRHQSEGFWCSKWIWLTITNHLMAWPPRGSLDITGTPLVPWCHTMAAIGSTCGRFMLVAGSGVDKGQWHHRNGYTPISIWSFLKS